MIGEREMDGIRSGRLDVGMVVSLTAELRLRWVLQSEAPIDRQRTRDANPLPVERA